MSGLLEEIRTTIAGAAERLGASVVGLGEGRGGGRGSGVVVGDGRVLTVAHAVRRDEPVVRFAGGRAAPGSVAAVDPLGNIAAIAVDTGDAPAVVLAPNAPGIGAPVLALARPGGRALRASLGFVTTADSSLRGRGGRRLEGVIEHTAALPRGASGGPLFDTDDELVGLNALRSDGGLILALPAGASLAARIDALFRGETPARPYLGLALAPAHVARRLRRAVGLPERDGALVRGVADGGPGATAGLQRGDLIVGAAGRPVGGIDDLHAALDGHGAGDTIELTVDRAGHERVVALLVGDLAEARR